MQNIEFSLSVMIVKLHRYNMFFISVVNVLNFTVSSHSEWFFKAAVAENALYWVDIDLWTVFTIT
jgi:hypothetical protein